MRELTARQREILGFIESYLDDKRYPPSIREIAERFSISVKGAYDHVKALEKKGAIKIDGNRSRALEVVHEEGVGERIAYLPLIGSVAAGKPILASEDFEGRIAVPEGMARDPGSFALRVKGDSMMNAGILDGDIALIEPRQSAENGEIVVAMVGESATLKRFFKENNRVRLQAENPNYQPIFSQEVRILGRLKGIIRKY